MNISHFCIDRPIFATVISIVITLGGSLAMLASPIAQYPEITPPQITVSAPYPGATADVVANNVAAPIEQQVNGADNMIYMSSSSSSTGNYSLNVYFQIGNNPELAVARCDPIQAAELAPTSAHAASSASISRLDCPLLISPPVSGDVAPVALTTSTPSKLCPHRSHTQSRRSESIVRRRGRCTLAP